MSQVVAKKNATKLADQLSKKTRFSKSEIESLIGMFRTLTRDKGEKMDRNKFRDVLHNTFDMTDDIIMDRIFRAFDRDSDSSINTEEWVEGLSVFLRGDLDEKMRYSFNVYDLNGDGFISREEMFSMLKSSLTKQLSEEDPDEGVKDLVELALKKMDIDHDSRVSFEDFKKAVGDEPLLLEAFGPCLPDKKTVDAFFATFADSRLDDW